MDYIFSCVQSTVPRAWRQNLSGLLEFSIQSLYEELERLPRGFCSLGIKQWLAERLEICEDVWWCWAWRTNGFTITGAASLKILIPQMLILAGSTSTLQIWALVLFTYFSDCMISRAQLDEKYFPRQFLHEYPWITSSRVGGYHFFKMVTDFIGDWISQYL